MSRKYTPQEAAIMVLAKAQELYKASPLAKGDWNKIHDKLEGEGYSKESADKIDGAIKAKVEEKKLHKDEGMDPSMAMSEDAPKEKPMKGPYKLAKWCGRMEHKRGMAKSTTSDAPAPAPQDSRPNGGPQNGQPAQVAAPKPAQAPTQPSGQAPTAPPVQTPAPSGEHKAIMDHIHSITKPKV